MMFTAAWLSLVSLIVSASCRSSNYHRKAVQSMSIRAEEFPFRNTSLSWDARVEDLVSRLTLKEVQQQLARDWASPPLSGPNPSPAIPRLGIGPYQWDTECLTGDSGAPGSATGFPASLGLAAAFNQSLVNYVAAAISKEVRGKHNVFVTKGVYHEHTGASCFAPVVNIARDPRWGRNQETYGEDPFLSGEMGKSYVQGLQGDHHRFVRASAGCKHFDVHGGPENIPESRLSFNANVTEADWRMTFLPAFKKCVDAGTFSIMCSYNRLNGVPTCANKKLLTDILRKEWGFKGYVVSDEGAVQYMISKHKYLDTRLATAVACVSAGCSIELSVDKGRAVFDNIETAVKQGQLSEQLVRERVKPLFYTRMRLGEFDPPDTNPYAALGEEQVETIEHQELAVKAAAESYVLLKNQHQFLPLQEGYYTNVALVGPMANNSRQIFADYYAKQPRHFTKTPLDALTLEFPHIKYGEACTDETKCKEYKSEIVQNTVKDADLIFVALGTGPMVEAEANDRADVELPGQQKQLLLDAIKHARPDAKIVLLLFNANPLNVTFADENPRVDAILECFFPGQGTGEALLRVLFNKGNNSSPAGRLPMTWPKYAWQIPPMVNYSMSGRTYRYLDTEPLYPFGYGLSYSQFKYSDLRAAASHPARRDLKATVQVKNKGEYDANEVIQCYIGPAKPQPHPVPRRSLGFFHRVHLSAGQSMVVTATLPSQIWAVWKSGAWTYPVGEMILSCGGGQPKARGSSFISITVHFRNEL